MDTDSDTAARQPAEAQGVRVTADHLAVAQEITAEFSVSVLMGLDEAIARALAEAEAGEREEIAQLVPRHIGGMDATLLVRVIRARGRS